MSRIACLLVLGCCWLATGCGRTVYTAPDPEPRASASNEPVVAGKPLSHWVKDLKSKDVGRRRSAASFLGDAGNKHAVAPLLEALKDQDVEVRVNAARSLGVVGPTVKETLQPLMGALHDPEDKVKAAAANALCNYKDEAKAAVPTLIQIFQSTKDNGLRAEAARALNVIDRDAARAAKVPQP